MNKNKLFGIFYSLLGLVVAVGTQTVFQVCQVEEKIMKCYWTGKAMLVMGGLLLLVGLGGMCIAKGKDANTFTGVMAAGCGFGIIAFPSFIIGGCSKVTMLCRTTTFPILYLLGGIVVAIALVHIYLSAKKERV